MGRQYTDEEIAEFAEADAARLTKAEQALADPAEMARLVSRLLTTRSPRLLRFSLRNQSLVDAQAAERGTTITDLDSARGWRDRGRSIYPGEIPYRLVVPKGTKTKKDDSATAEAKASDTGEGTDAGDVKFSRMFRMRPYWEYSQTVGLDDDMPGNHPYEVEDPEQELRDTFTDQLARFGYRVEVADVDTATVDDDAEPPTVTVPAADDLTGMASALGSIYARPHADRPPMLPDTRSRDDSQWITNMPDGASRVRLAIQAPSVSAVVTPHPDRGVVTYKVSGKRAYGTFSVFSEDAANHDAMTSAIVKFGDWSEGDPFYHYDAPELPKINTVTVHGSSTGNTPQRVADGEPRYVWVRRGDSYRSEPAPDKTADRAAAIVRAILTDYFARDDLAELHQARARIEAPAHQFEAARKARLLQQQADKTAAEAAEAAADAVRYAAITAEGREDR